MKNKLLTALLTFATIPFFANEEVSKTQLLAHLKNIKTNMEAVLTEISSEETKMNEASREFYQEIKNLYNLIPDHASDHSNENNLVQNDLVGHINQIFDVFAKPLFSNIEEDISPERMMGFYAFYNFFKDDFIVTHKEEIESILTKIDSILIKYDNSNAQSQNKYTSVLERETAPEKVLEHCIFINPAIIAELDAGKQSQDKSIPIIKAKLNYCIFILGPTIGMSIAAKKTWPILLQKIDAKIAELEIIL